MKQGIQGICLDTLLLQVCAAARHLVCRRTCAGVRARVCVCVFACAYWLLCVYGRMCVMMRPVRMSLEEPARSCAGVHEHFHNPTPGRLCHTL